MTRVVSVRSPRWRIGWPVIPTMRFRPQPRCRRSRASGAGWHLAPQDSGFDGIVTDSSFRDTIPYSGLTDLFHFLLGRLLHGLSGGADAVFFEPLGPEWGRGRQGSIGRPDRSDGGTAAAIAAGGGIGQRSTPNLDTNGTKRDSLFARKPQALTGLAGTGYDGCLTLEFLGNQLAITSGSVLRA